jgi:SAM-dependent methyltransferase
LMSASSQYVLGHTEYELERLARQARLVDPITRRFFMAAGIAEGMRVLDVGSGAGHTAMLLADIVGPSGEIVGVDLSKLAIEAAKRRVAAAGVTNITFQQGDPATMALGQFDAVAGRYVLMFIPDPVVVLAKLRTLVRPGGPIVFHEPDWDGVRCNPPSPVVPSGLRMGPASSGAVRRRRSDGNQARRYLCGRRATRADLALRGPCRGGAGSNGSSPARYRTRNNPSF